MQKGIKAKIGNKEAFKAAKKKIKELGVKISEEEVKGRKITRTEERGKPLPCYFNCGCGLYPDGLTALEIEDDVIRLAKWHNKLVNNRYREIYEDGNGKTLSDFIKEVRG